MHRLQEFRGDSVRAGRRPRRVVDRFISFQKTGRGLHPSEPARAAGDLREPVAAGDSGDVPRDRLCGLSPVELRAGYFSC